MARGLPRLLLSRRKLRRHFAAFAAYVQEGGRFLLARRGEPIEIVTVDPSCLPELRADLARRELTRVRVRLSDGRVVGSSDLCPAERPTAMRRCVLGGPILEGALAVGLVSHWSGVDPSHVAGRLHDALTGRSGEPFEQNRFGSRQTSLRFGGVTLRVDIPITALDALFAVGESARERKHIARDLARTVHGSGPGEVRWSFLWATSKADIVHADAGGREHAVSIKHTRAPVLAGARIPASGAGNCRLGEMLRSADPQALSHGPGFARELALAAAEFVRAHGTDVIVWAHPDGAYAVAHVADVAGILASCRPVAAAAIPTRAMPRSLAVFDAEYRPLAIVTELRPDARWAEIQLTVPPHVLGRVAKGSVSASDDKKPGTAGERCCSDARRSPSAERSLPTFSAGISATSAST